MKKIIGKYNEAIVFTDVIDEPTEKQIKTLLDQEFTKDSKIRIMPDCHAGAGCVIGTTMNITDKVVPNLVGVDIGCGILVVSLGNIDIDFEKLDEVIRKHIPSGRNVHEISEDSSITKGKISDTKFFAVDVLARDAASIGTLGGGNHFIEIDQDEEGNKYLVIHTGSRNLGKRIAEKHQQIAIDYHHKKERKNVLEEIKANFPKEQWQTEIEKHKETHIEIPDELCYLEGDEMKAYLKDLKRCQKYAEVNREMIANIICMNMNWKQLDSFESVHNYIDLNWMILRKGAIEANLGQLLIIPINMRDGCIIGRGKGNPDYNYSAPHGAGRLMSRSQANEKISLEEFKETMEGIYSTSINENTIDESPFAYKSMDDIIENIKDTVEIEKIIKPIYNFKASD